MMSNLIEKFHEDEIAALQARKPGTLTREAEDILKLCQHHPSQTQAHSPGEIVCFECVDSALQCPFCKRPIARERSAVFLDHNPLVESSPINPFSNVVYEFQFGDDGSMMREKFSVPLQEFARAPEEQVSSSERALLPHEEAPNLPKFTVEQFVIKKAQGITMDPIQPVQSPDGGYLHTVRPTDTLVGIALRYGVKPEEIKRANRMMSDSIVQLSVLRIPIKGAVPPLPADTPAAIQARRIAMKSRFMQAASCDAGEANYYLTETDFDYDAALKQFTADKEWEAKHGKR